MVENLRPATPPTLLTALGSRLNRSLSNPCLLLPFLTAVALFANLIVPLWLVAGRMWYSSALCAAFIVFLSLRPSRLQIAFSGIWGALVLVTFTALFHQVIFRQMGVRPVEQTAIRMVAFTGIGCLDVGIIACMQAHTLESRGEAVGALLRCLAFPLAPIPVDFFLLHWSPEMSWDRVLLASDAALGLQLSFWTARLARSVPGGMRFLQWVYEALPIAMGGGYAIASGRRRTNLALGLITAGLLGRALHPIVPAAGPGFVFVGDFPFHEPALSLSWIRPVFVGDFPFHEPALSLSWILPIRVNLILNCVPSLHFAWALLVYWALRPAGRTVRTIATLFVVFTATATLALGEHYFLDLVIAVPFALAISTLCSKTDFVSWPAARTAAGVWGAGAVAVWMALLRAGVMLRAPAWLGWALVVVTLGASLVLERRLFRTLSAGIPAAGTPLHTACSPTARSSAASPIPLAPRRPPQAI